MVVVVMVVVVVVVVVVFPFLPLNELGIIHLPIAICPRVSARGIERRLLNFNNDRGGGMIGAVKHAATTPPGTWTATTTTTTTRHDARSSAVKAEGT